MGRWLKPVLVLRVVNPAPRRTLTLVIERPGLVRRPLWRLGQRRPLQFPPR